MWLTWRTESHMCVSARPRELRGDTRRGERPGERPGEGMSETGERAEVILPAVGEGEGAREGDERCDLGLGERSERCDLGLGE